jgi:hypothetical protein
MTKTLTSALAVLAMLSAGSLAYAGEHDTVDGIRQYGPQASVLTTKPVNLSTPAQFNVKAPAFDHAAGGFDGAGN